MGVAVEVAVVEEDVVVAVEEDVGVVVEDQRA